MKKPVNSNSINCNSSYSNNSYSNCTDSVQIDLNQQQQVLQLQPQQFHFQSSNTGANVVWPQQQQQQQQPTIHPVTIHPLPFNVTLQPLLPVQQPLVNSSLLTLQPLHHQQHQQQQPLQFHLNYPLHPNLSIIASTTGAMPSSLPTTTHNLIPLQNHTTATTMATTTMTSNQNSLVPVSSNACSNNNNILLHGTPGYPPAIISPQQQLIGYNNASSNPGNATTISQHLHATETVQIQNLKPFYTVQERPFQQPVYNGVNLNYPGLRCILQQDYIQSRPPIYCVDNFLNDSECQFLIDQASDSFGPAPVVGRGTGEVSPSRTSSTCYLAREDVPDVLRKVALLTGKPIEHCELPQVGRYYPTQQYLQHYDAFDLRTEDGRRFASNGGQRTVTVLIYLNTVMRGGATKFPTLDIAIQPVRGMALIFFPATVDGLLDEAVLHAALPAIDTKYVSQIWIRQTTYAGQPSKRLSKTLGVPFGSEQQPVQQQQHNLQLTHNHCNSLKALVDHGQGVSDMQF